jgi:hypothetical protein
VPSAGRSIFVAAAHGLDWIAAAPLCLCIAGVFECTTSNTESEDADLPTWKPETAADNVMLPAVALDLATTMVRAFNDDEVGELWDSTRIKFRFCLPPVGRRPELTRRA